MLAAVRAAVDGAREDNNFWHVDDEAWAQIKEQSFDYAILEKTKKIACVKFDGGWSDLGDWNAVAGQLPHDEEGNFITGTASQLDCQNTTVWSAGNGTQLVGLGLKNIVTVVMDDAVLVANAGCMQDVRDVVEHLEQAGIMQANQHAKDYRPWGWFESLLNMPGYQVKRLYLRAKLCPCKVQTPFRTLVVVSGLATVVLDDQVLSVATNESVYIRAGHNINWQITLASN